MKSLEQDAPIEIARFLDIRQAELALSVLRGSAIDAYLDQPFTASIAPHYMLGSGGVRLFVGAGDMDRATLLLKSTEGSD